MTNKFLHIRFFLRELKHGWRHGLIFILCVALSLTTIAALNSFKGGVNRSLFRDARELHGADIIIHSHYPLSPGLVLAIKQLENNGEAISTMVHEFYSVVRSSEDPKTLFANLKSVDQRFPLYGNVELASGRQLGEVLQSGTCIVAEDVLKRLELQLGDTLEVGRESLKIVDMVVHESDSPVNILSFGPRVMVPAADLDRIDLVKRGSRVEYELLLKLDDASKLNTIAAQLREKAIQGQERINTYRDAESGIKRFFENLLFFLSLISIFTLLLAGLGMQSCITALIRQKEKTVAVTRTLGGTSAFLYRHYLLIVLFLGFIGASIGVLCGLLLGSYLPTLFTGLLPVHGETGISVADLGEGLFLGLLVVLLFTFLPLHRLRNIKPVAIFRSEKIQSRRDLIYYLVTAAGITMITLLVIRQLEDRNIGLYFMGGVFVLIAVITFFASLITRYAKRIKLANLTLRQAVRSMTRIGNATRSIVITLASALSLLFSIYLVEHNLHVTYIESYPPDAPNLFMLDIQKDQRDGFSEFFEEQPTLFPIIRARLMAINDKPIQRDEELRKKRDNFAREFNLTYRKYLLEDEVIAEGESLFADTESGTLQVSILDTVADMGDLKLGDMLLFNIQGVEVEAQVASIRTRTKSMLYPFFYFVFPGDYLKSAPQTLFGAVTVEKDNLASLQTRILRQYPNISFINVTETAKDLEVLMLKLSSIVNFFASFSIFAGGLILISSILATRLARIRESVYYKVLGSKTTFVYKVFIYESGVLGLISAVIALFIAHCGSWAICYFLFEIDYLPNIAASVFLVGITVGFVVATGLLSSVAIVRQKPARFLREHGNG